MAQRTVLQSLFRPQMPFPRRSPGKLITCSLPAVRVYPEELQQIRNSACLQGLSVSEYIRTQCLANSAPFSSPFSPNKPSENTPSPVQVSSDSPLAALDHVQVDCEDKKKREENAGPVSHIHKRASAKSLPNKTECPHGYKIIGGRTACSECKRKL